MVYNFNVGEVGPEKMTFIDPLVAAGYTYEKGAGDSNFKSVQIVTDAGDGLYDVQIWNGSAWVTVRTGLGGGQTYDFVLDAGDADGVEKFHIVGIETDAALNPFDLTAFVTGLSFMTQGVFTGTMSPIIVDVPDATVPVPGTLLLLVAGIAGVGVVRRPNRTAAGRS